MCSCCSRTPERIGGSRNAVLRHQARPRGPEGEPEQVRIPPRDRRDQARPPPVVLGGVPNRLRVHPGHSVARRPRARRDGLRVGADVSRLRRVRTADRPVRDGRTSTGSTTTFWCLPCDDPGWKQLLTDSSLPPSLHRKPRTVGKGRLIHCRVEVGRCAPQTAAYLEY